MLSALERREELLGILHSSVSRDDAIDRIERELGVSLDAATMLLDLRLEQLLPEYALRLRAAILADDAN